MRNRLPAESPIRLPGLPIYYQIARLLQARVYHEIYKPGDPLPSENDLSLEFGVSRQTVRQALRELVDEGIVVTRRGQGTFVRDEPRAVPPINFVGYLDDLELQASTMTISIERVSQQLAPPHVSAALDRKREEPVILVERTGYNRSVPVNNSMIYMSLEIADYFRAEDLTRGALMTVLSELGMEINHALQSFSASAADNHVADRLQISPGSPVIYSELTVFADSYPAMFSAICYRPDRTSFTASLATIPNLKSDLKRLPKRDLGSRDGGTPASLVALAANWGRDNSGRSD